MPCVSRSSGSIVCVLASSLAAFATVFAVVRGVLLEPLPFREPDRLV
jgi:hypothetical protein